MTFVHFCTIDATRLGGKVKREQLLRLLAKDAKASGLDIAVDMARGKGGHCVVRCGDKFSVIKSGEITPLMEQVIRKQLALPSKGR